MKFTLGWLREHLDTTATVDEITERLTMLGLEVEGVQDRGRALRPFVIAHVKAARQHPNADRLRLCVVDTGGETLEVVCGAPNARAGMKGVFAPVGTVIPASGVELKRAKIRGVESNGMLCSEREMGLSDEHEGIIELPEDAPVGARFAEWAGLDDPVIEIGLTPNRGDCAAVRGIARDLAAAGLGRLKPLDVTPVTGSYDSPIRWRRDFPAGADAACPLVVGRHFRNVTNGESPEWLKRRLESIGLRPISALVDITNYLTFDLARPLHVFDADAVSGDLVMRFARKGESIGALDGRTYGLDDSVIVIADDDGPQAIGGVMGGEGSGCGADTRNVFLEVALFDSNRVAAAGRRLGILSDARYRFERGIDPTSALWGAEIATRMILDICGGEASTLTVAGEMPKWQRESALRVSRILSLGGLAVPADRASNILNALGFETRTDGDVVHAAVPPWRPDVEGEADLVEEVLRIEGYDAIPAVPLTRPHTVPKPVRSPAQNRAETVRRTLAARGMVEAVTFSFLPRARAALFGGVKAELVLDNPISADLDAMRPSVLPNLLDAARRNLARGIENPALFEVGPQYASDQPEGQALVAAGLRAGATGARHWAERPRPVDAFDAKADALAALAAAGVAETAVQAVAEAPAWYHPGRSGTLRLGQWVVAHFGEIDPRTLRAMDVAGPVAAFELMLDNLPQPKEARGAARPPLKLSALQPVRRDFAFLVDAKVTAAELLRAARSADRALVAEVSLFDMFAGEGVPAGKKSLAIAVTLQPVEATLTDAEIEAVAARIVAAVKKATGAELRG